jgi:glycosyltransferase involved in cell wall biosynthesis
MFLNQLRKNINIFNSIFSKNSTSLESLELDFNLVLLVGMADSPHLIKWLTIMEKELPERRIIIFPSDRPRFRHTQNSVYKKNRNRKLKVFKIVPYNKLNFALYFLLDKLMGDQWRSYFLARLIIRNKPGIIHFHEMQHGAYIFNHIFNDKEFRVNSKKIISTWGSDLTLYSWVDEHINQIKLCLSWADILTAEREEELSDAKRLGFQGDFRAPVYITIGQDPSDVKDQIQPSSRKLILVKGHQSATGRALNVLQAISQISDQLWDFEILFYSAPKSVQAQVKALRKKLKLNIRVLPKIGHGEMLNFFYGARVSISVAVSDGLPGVLVEAMQAGAFPIQSSNSAGKDFIVHGENGFLVEPWDIESIKECILDAINNNILVDHASEINQQILKEKYSLNEGIQKLRKLYL